MKISEIREKTVEELDKLLGELRKDLFNRRFQLATNQLEDTSVIRKIKRSIARVLTVKTELYLNK